MPAFLKSLKNSLYNFEGQKISEDEFLSKFTYLFDTQRILFPSFSTVGYYEKEDPSFQETVDLLSRGIDSSFSFREISSSENFLMFGILIPEKQLSLFGDISKRQCTYCQFEFYDESSKFVVLQKLSICMPIEEIEKQFVKKS